MAGLVFRVGSLCFFAVVVRVCWVCRILLRVVAALEVIVIITTAIVVIVFIL